MATLQYKGSRQAEREIVPRDPIGCLEHVYRENYRDFLRVAAALTGSREGAMDAVHDAFVDLIRHRTAFRGAGTVEAWAWKAVINAARKVGRRQRMSRREVSVHESATTSYEFDDSVRRALARLPDRQRLVLFLRYYADLDYATIGEVAGIASGTVAATLHAGQQALRLALSKEQTDA